MNLSVKKHLRRLGEGISVLLIIFAIFKLMPLIFEANATLLYFLATIAILMMCYIVGAVIED